MIQLVIAVVIFLAGAAAGVKWQVGIHAQKELERIAATERETLRRTDKIDASAEKHEKVKEVIRTKFVPIVERVEHEVTKVEYRDRACLSDDSLRIVADAIAAIAPAASQPAPAVSNLKPPRRWFSRFDPKVGSGND